jgi:hypothetical protein
MQHMPELMGMLLAAAPGAMRTGWQIRLSQVNVHPHRHTIRVYFGSGSSWLLV